MQLWHILLILFVHTVADFVFQTDRMAKGKSTDSKILADHIVVYTIFMVPVVLLLPNGLVWGTRWLLLNAVLHFATDFVTSRMTSYLWQKGDRHNFFVVIGFDQFLHAAALLTTYQWLLT